MCGITGYINFDKNNICNKEKLAKMTNSLYHRGPDGLGLYLQKNVALGHRRLSIIDLDTGTQPMANDDNTIIITFNGEIYNYIELKKELQKRNITFRTNSDTEVLLKAYEIWGINCLKKLNGMWAFAIWDWRKKELFISRDRFGEKPLYYAIFENTFIFGSEIKSILQYEMPGEIRTDLFEIYLTLGYIPSPYSFYKNINKLQPGHCGILKDDNFQIFKYWDLTELDENNLLNNRVKIYEEFEYLLKDSVRIRMRSDVPYGAFLSGGLDSSVIVSIMAELTKQPVETFTIGFDHEEFDERPIAQTVVSKYNTNHHEEIVCIDSFDHSLKQIVFQFDEPFGDSSSIPMGYVSKFAREHVKMVLTGDGGDEALSGYPGYLGVKYIEIYKKLPYFIQIGFPPALQLVANFVMGRSKYKLNRIINFFEAASLSFNDCQLVKSSLVKDYKFRNSLLTDYNNQIPVKEFFNQLMSHCSYQNYFYKLMYANFKLFLAEDILTKVDRMSMAYSLETRIPFLDYRLIEFLVTVDRNVKVDGNQTKSILRKSLGNRLPKEVLQSKKKGFSVPLREWFKDKTFEHKINSLTVLCDYGFNYDTLNEITSLHRSGKKDYGFFIWNLFVLKEFLLNE